MNASLMNRESLPTGRVKRGREKGVGTHFRGFVPKKRPDPFFSALPLRDGRALFCRQGTSMMAVRVETRDGFRASPPEVLFSDSSYVGVGGSFDVAADGRLLMTKDLRASESRHLVVVSNWFDELTRLTASH